MKIRGCAATIGFAAALLLAGCAGPPAAPANPRALLWVRVYREGASMEPTLGNKGESVVAVFYPYQALKAGDIVLYWSEPRRIFILHRLKEFRAGFGWTVQGDNPVTNSRRDPEWVTQASFIGLAVLPGAEPGAAVSLSKPADPVSAVGSGR